MRRRLLIAVLLLALGAEVAPAGAARSQPRAFCKATIVHDYAAPLAKLPPLTPPPTQLPFGPRNLSLEGGSAVIVGEGFSGYGFFDETYRSRTLRLDWEITARLSRIDGRGEALREIAKRTLSVGEVADPSEEIDLSLKVPPGPASYRYDLEFRSLSSGELLGAYGHYLRTVRPTFHAGIALERRTVPPGQLAVARVENRGSEWIGFGASYSVQRFEGGRWGPDLLAGSTWPSLLIGMPGGAGGWCMRYRVPADAESGRYRFAKHLGSHDGQGGLRTALFRVAG